MDKAKFLQIIRDQLQIMADFMASTGCSKPHQDALWWVGPMPANVQLYTPAKWQQKNKSVCTIWLDYLSAVKKEGLDEHLAKASVLPIADLLAASLEAERERET